MIKYLKSMTQEKPILAVSRYFSQTDVTLKTKQVSKSVRDPEIKSRCLCNNEFSREHCVHIAFCQVSVIVATYSQGFSTLKHR